MIKLYSSIYWKFLTEPKDLEPGYRTAIVWKHCKTWISKGEPKIYGHIHLVAYTTTTGLAVQLVFHIVKINLCTSLIIKHPERLSPKDMDRQTWKPK